MTLEEFTVNLEKEFEDIEPGTFGPDTNYRDIKNWSSIYALIVVAFVDLNFDVILNAKDLKETNTIRELYELVQQKNV
jgi:acyl carrier protein